MVVINIFKKKKKKKKCQLLVLEEDNRAIFYDAKTDQDRVYAKNFAYPLNQLSKFIKTDGSIIYIVRSDLAAQAAAQDIRKQEISAYRSLSNLFFNNKNSSPAISTIPSMIIILSLIVALIFK